MVLGRFYFKQTANGNLLGEFSNSNSDRNITESANITGNFIEPFIGNYTSAWVEGGAQSLNLSIRFKNDTIYILRWTNNNGNTVFIGEGFIVDDILIGDYRDDELQRTLPEILNLPPL